MNQNQDNNQPLVAIRCMTYNHEKYIEDALKGFVTQDTDFPFAAIVMDDASTDKEPEVLWNFINKELDLSSAQKDETDDYTKVTAPHKKNKKCTFVIILLKYNHYGKKDKTPYLKICENSAKYIAFCEGDDYWTDPLKLQREVDFLEKNDDYVAIAENGLVKNSIKNIEYQFSNEDSRDLTVKEMIIKRRFPWASVVCKKNILEKREAVTKFAYDTMICCFLCSQGKFRYNNIVSSVYRRGLQGVTEFTDKYKWAKLVETWNLELKRLFCPKYVDETLISNIIWNQYLTAFEYGNRKTKISAIFKMYKYGNFFLTSKYLIKRLYVHFKSL